MTSHQKQTGANPLEHPYYQAARYPNKTAAGKAYTPIEQIIHDEDCDLSAYRYLVPSEHTWYVVVIGEQPTAQLHERLKTILTTLTRGEPVTLDDATVLALLARRVQQMHLQKGLLVFVQGRLVVRPYTDKAQVKRVAIEIVASTVQMLEKGKQPPPDESTEDVPF
jgi:hypothetical protein